MELGEKIKQARLEAGLSQRQLCGDTVTRNMLSQIENGYARPSMDTLRIFAARLGKTLSYFLEEDAVLSPNQAVMARARAAYDSGRPGVSVGMTAEYDALPEIGHGCGHNIIATAPTGAAVALKSAIDDLGGKWCFTALRRRNVS